MILKLNLVNLDTKGFTIYVKMIYNQNKNLLVEVKYEDLYYRN